MDKPNSKYFQPTHIMEDESPEYSSAKDQLTNFRKIDFQGHSVFVMRFMNELVGELLTSENPCSYYTDRIKFIKESYDQDHFQDYCSIWLGDIYYFFDEFENAIMAWSDGLRPEKIWTLLSSKVLSLKLNQKVQIRATEALSYKNNLTKFAKNNMELLIRYADQIFERDYSDGTICTEYLIESNEFKLRLPGLFSGCSYGYYLNSKYQNRVDPKYEYVIESMPNIVKYIKDVGRRAENAVREDLGMPQVGEGWISETELYYKLKEHFNQYTVIQHFNDTWLGRQHLDVYIKELNVGIEYHGLQHFQPVDFFGGEVSFLENQKRDRNKLRKCRKNSTRLVIVTEGYNLENVISEIEGITIRGAF